MAKIIKNERVPGTSDQSLFRLSKNFRKISSLMVTHKAVFKLFQNLNLQIYASQFMASQTIPLPFVHLNLESVERKKITKILIILFIVFKRLSLGEKNIQSDKK